MQFHDRFARGRLEQTRKNGMDGRGDSGRKQRFGKRQGEALMLNIAFPKRSWVRYEESLKEVHITHHLPRLP
jgi:hypothetical protein